MGARKRALRIWRAATKLALAERIAERVALSYGMRTSFMLMKSQAKNASTLVAWVAVVEKHIAQGLQARAFGRLARAAAAAALLAAAAAALAAWGRRRLVSLSLRRWAAAAARRARASAALGRWGRRYLRCALTGGFQAWAEFTVRARLMGRLVRHAAVWGRRSRRTSAFRVWARAARGATLLQRLAARHEAGCREAAGPPAFDRWHTNTVVLARRRERARLLLAPLGRAAAALGARLGLWSLGRHARAHAAAEGVQRLARGHLARSKCARLRRDLQNKQHLADVLLQRFKFRRWLAFTALRREATRLKALGRVWRGWVQAHREVRWAHRALRALTRGVGRRACHRALAAWRAAADLAARADMVLALAHAARRRRLWDRWRGALGARAGAREVAAAMGAERRADLAARCLAAWRGYRHYRRQKGCLALAAAAGHATFKSTNALAHWQEFTLTKYFLRVLYGRACSKYNRRLAFIFLDQARVHAIKSKRQKQHLLAAKYQTYQKSASKSIERWKEWMFSRAKQRYDKKKAGRFQTNYKPFHTISRWKEVTDEQVRTRSTQGAARAWCLGRQAGVVLRNWRAAARHERRDRRAHFRALVFAWKSLMGPIFSEWKTYSKISARCRKKVAAFVLGHRLPRLLRRWRITAAARRRFGGDAPAAAAARRRRRALAGGLALLVGAARRRRAGRGRAVAAGRRWLGAARRRGLRALVLHLVAGRRGRRRRRRLLRRRAQNLLLAVLIPWRIYVRQKKKLRKYHRRKALKRTVRVWRARVKIRSKVAALTLALAVRQDYKLQCAVFQRWLIGIHRRRRLGLASRAVAGRRAGRRLRACWRGWQLLRRENAGLGQRAYDLMVQSAAWRMRRALGAWRHTRRLVRTDRCTRAQRVFDAWSAAAERGREERAAAAADRARGRAEAGRLFLIRLSRFSRGSRKGRRRRALAAVHRNRTLAVLAVRRWHRWQSRRDLAKGQWLFGLLRNRVQRWRRHTISGRLFRKRRTMKLWKRFVAIRHRREHILADALGAALRHVLLGRCLSAWARQGLRGARARRLARRVALGHARRALTAWAAFGARGRALRRRAAAAAAGARRRRARAHLRAWLALGRARRFVRAFRDPGRWGYRLLQFCFREWAYVPRIRKGEEVAANFYGDTIVQKAFRGWQYMVANTDALQAQLLAQGTAKGLLLRPGAGGGGGGGRGASSLASRIAHLKRALEDDQQ